MKAVCVVLGILLMGPSALHAEERKTYVAGFGGSTFGTASAPTFGLEAGRQINSGLEVYVNAGRLRDVTLKSDQDWLRQLTAETGFRFEGQQPATFFLAGVKVRIPVSGPVHPYAVSGVGVGRLGAAKLTIDGVDASEILSGSPGMDATSGLALEVGAGVVVPRGMFHLDLGYRLMQVVEGVRTSRFYGGAGIRF
jgi:hypothetical protein